MFIGIGLKRSYSQSEESCFASYLLLSFLKYNQEPQISSCFEGQEEDLQLGTAKS